METQEKRTIRANPWWALASVAFGVIMVGLDATVVAIANPFIARDLHANLADLQWVTNAYLLTTAVLLIPAGKLADRIGRRATFLVGMLGFAAASAGVGLAGSIGWVIAFRAIQGGFGALIMPSTLAILRASFPVERLNTAIGIWGASSGLAIAGGPIVAGLLVQNVSWQSVFYLNVPVGAIGILLGLFVLAESREQEPDRLDAPGTIVLAGTLFSLVFGLIKAQSWGWLAGRTWIFFGLAIVGAVIFVFVEGRARFPLVPLGMFGRRQVSLSAVVVILSFFAFFGVVFFVALYLQEVHGYSPVAAGVRVLPLTASFVVGAPLGAALNGRFGPRVPVGIGMAAIAVGLALLTTLGVSSSYLVHLALPFVIVGLGIGLVMPTTSDTIVANVPEAEAGVAGGVQSTAVQIGGLLGTAVLGSVLSNRVGSVLISKLEAAGVPGVVATRLGPARPLIAEGLAPRIPQVPALVQTAVTNGSHAAFMSGLHVAMIVAIGVAIVGAIVGLALGAVRVGSGHRASAPLA
ncbi:drug resistance transporter, EmrB/QacA subfamily [Acidimicrobium ferrooxidans DSM 10331]|uniref:Drug resistance transporter, EmrB/QacA subfamily n=1 Tax=Acidimicrobium ferrooxidans (strain DSM 10331 / JCM 15462 / NBRC 103882 / ICP) TaxID=525909 RepID=C7M053_ACIFD|nr:MFS transporter [Acidimicrobium ferrooxidans]ACU54361.1 drug resistance transporter, EmrB/QacA subfamily [Acidimicrobium ferrooxidans DSM 10331]